METELKTICGGCLCGALRYAGIGETYNVTHCHCEDCRKSVGAIYDLGFISAEQFSIYEGKTA